MASVLGIDVPPRLLASWVAWLAPDPQPFLIAPQAAWPCVDEGGSLTKELHDTYRLWWGVTKGSGVIWISEAQFALLPRPTRAALVREQVARRRGAVPTVRAWQDLLDPATLRAQADGHRFVWWPSLIAGRTEDILSRIVSTDRLPSRHAEVDDAIWRGCRLVLPEARRLAGTFPSRSDANCFTTVMAAAGETSGAALDDVGPFDAWLRATCSRGGDTDRPGVVMVWRNRDAVPVHAAVAIGGGWGLEKASTDWHAPRAVVAVADIMRMSRHPGERVERHTIAP
jgi:hypothetical protein